ncbi:MAG: hypothetical protein IJ068_07260 [Bacilli bacterium]|nr:hypothetical protein [Bacilli bacterium]
MKKIMMCLMLFFIPSICFAKTIKINSISYEVNDYLTLDGLYYNAINDNLILTNAKLKNIKSDYDLNITLVGNNTITSTKYPYCISAKNVTINGLGILNLNSVLNGINASSLVVSDGIIYGSVTKNLFYINEDSTNLTINNSKIIFDSKEEGFYVKNGNVNINDSTIIAKQIKQLTDDSNNNVYLNNSKLFVLEETNFGSNSSIHIDDNSKIFINSLNGINSGRLDYNQVYLGSVDDKLYHEGIVTGDKYLKINMENVEEFLDIEEEKIELDKKLIELKVKEDELIKLEQELNDRQNELNERQPSSNDQEMEIQNLNNYIENQKLEIQELKTYIQNQESDLLNQKNILENKELELMELNDSLNNKELELISQSDSLNNRELELIEFSDELNEKESNLMKRENNLDEVSNILLEKSASIEALSNILNGRTIENENIRESLEKEKLELDSLKMYITLKEKELLNKEKEVSNNKEKKEDDKVEEEPVIYGTKEVLEDDILEGAYLYNEKNSSYIDKFGNLFYLLISYIGGIVTHIFTKRRING